MDSIHSNNSTYELGWWLEILTAQPMCLYYFGAFKSQQEAVDNQAGFVEDLLAEKAIILSMGIHFLQPTQITLMNHDLQEHILKFKKITKHKNLIRSHDFQPA